MSKWGWNQSAIFLAGLVCATSVLVAAGLAEDTTVRAPSTATIGSR